MIIRRNEGPSTALERFVDLSPAARRELAERGRERRWDRGEVLRSRPDPPEAVYAITEGLAGMVARTPNGYRRILYLYRPGEVAGSPTPADESPEVDHEIEAITPVAALEIPREVLEEVGERHPELLIDLGKAYSRQIRDLGRRLMAVMSVDVRVRLARVLLDLSAGDAEPVDEPVPLAWPLTHRELAQVVGASRPHVSTVLGELAEEGVVERRGQRSLLVVPARLAEIVGGR